MSKQGVFNTMYDNGLLQYSMNWHKNILKSIKLFNKDGNYIKTVNFKQDLLKEENDDKTMTCIKVINNDDNLYVSKIKYIDNKIINIIIIDENGNYIYKYEVINDKTVESINYHNLMIFNRIDGKFDGNYQSLYPIGKFNKNINDITGGIIFKIINKDITDNITCLYDYMIKFITEESNLEYKKTCELNNISCLDLDDDICSNDKIKYYISKNYKNGKLDGEYIEHNNSDPDYYRNEYIKCEYKDGELNGKYYEKQYNDNKEIDCNYKDGQLDGEHIEKNDNLTIKTEFVDDHKIKRKQYHNNQLINIDLFERNLSIVLKNNIVKKLTINNNQLNITQMHDNNNNKDSKYSDIVDHINKKIITYQNGNRFNIQYLNNKKEINDDVIDSINLLTETRDYVLLCLWYLTIIIALIIVMKLFI